MDNYWPLLSGAVSDFYAWVRPRADQAGQKEERGRRWLS